METKFKLIIVAMFLSMGAFFTNAQAQIVEYDGFEGSMPETFWYEEDFLQRGEISTEHSLEGNKSLKFWWEAEDPDDTTGESKHSEINTLGEPASQRDNWYAWSVYFPSTENGATVNRSDPEDMIIMQLHMNDGVSNPVISMSVANNAWGFTYKWGATDDQSSRGVVMGTRPHDTWVNFVMHIRWSSDGYTNNGIMEFWKDGVKLVDEFNVPVGWGLSQDKWPYYKMGIYHYTGGSNGRDVIHFDEFKHGYNVSYDEIATTGGSGGDDTQAPSVPSGLSASNKTQTSFRLNWAPSTDNVGVVSYDVYRNNVFYTNVTGTFANITGLTANTTYAMTVEAIDAANNYSEPNTPFNAKTLAVGEVASSTTWQSFNVSTQTGTFTAAFDAVPNNTTMDGVIGIQNGTATDYPSLACAVRFINGKIDARNGTAYASATVVNYTAGTNYRFRLVINRTAKTYSIFVTPAGQAEITLGTNYAFRTEQASVAQLTGWSLYSSVGSHNVRNMTFTPVSGSASLTGSVAVNSTAVNLTTVGASDWKHFRNNDHKASGSMINSISNYTTIGGAASFYNDDLRNMSWTGGTPTATGTNNKNGVFIGGINKGFSFTAPAGNGVNVLKVYVGGFSSTGRLTARLSNSAAADYVNATPTGAGGYNAVYTITYNAAQAGQTITISWVQTAGAGNVTIQGAALAGSGGAMAVKSVEPAAANVAATLQPEVSSLIAIGFYPNPATDVVNIDFKTNLNSEEAEVKLTDLMGRKVYSSGIISQVSTLQINTSAYPKGNYVISIRRGTEKVNKLLIIE